MTPADFQTINDFFSLIGRVVIWAGGIAGAVAGIWALVTKIRSRGAMAKLTKRVDDDEVQLKDHSVRIKTLEEATTDNRDEFQDLHEVSRLTLSAVQQILKSSLENGNNHAGMQKASNDIDEYLKSKI